MACQSHVLLLHPAQPPLTGKTQPSPFMKTALPISLQSGRSKSPTFKDLDQHEHTAKSDTGRGCDHHYAEGTRLYAAACSSRKSDSAVRTSGMSAMNIQISACDFIAQKSDL
ncbi:hypothetical protein WMY93_024939 [Mugilogobius chulae]|uniref:Uncharacterized protein n=1 Tax=Mugilogobius chulae TaxID=88201 RepID=A0AAW0ND09_9GOBI